VSEKTKSKPRPSLAGDLFALISHVHASCNRDLADAISERGLTLSQVRLLHYLAHVERAPTIKQIGRAISVGPPAATRIVDELDGRGLVDRVADDTDARTKRVLITPAGRETLEQLGTPRLSAVRRFTASLDEGERAKLTPALRKLLERDEIAARRPTPEPAR
jgi:DNA-binding MarR family transcriptional regulator